MALTTRTTKSGFLLPSIHSWPAFFTHQPKASTDSLASDHWAHLFLSYARHRKLFYLKVEDTEKPDSEWDEVLRNEVINRRLLPPYLQYLMDYMVANNQGVYEPPKQMRSVLLYWRTPDEWAETLHIWATSTGQLNTILTFYEIMDPPIESPLTGIPTVLLKQAVSILSKTGRAQTIAIAEGEGVRFFAR